jgi:TolA-binding protein
MKLIVFLIGFVLISGVLFLNSGCAPSAEEMDIYGEVIEETAEEDMALSEENARLKEELNKLRSEKAILEKSKSDLEKRLKSLEEENNQLRTKISELGAQLEAEKQKTRELSARVSELETPGATEQQLRERITELENELAQYKQQVRDLQAKLAEYEAGLQKGWTVAKEVAETEIEPIFPGTPVEEPVEMTEEDFRNYYKRGLELFNKYRYAEAIAYFDTLLRSTVDTKLKINCVYWIGESYFGMKKYEKAIEYFDYVAGTKSSKTADALYMLGRSYAALGKIKEAKMYMQRVLKEHPKAPVAKKARRLLDRL